MLEKAVALVFPVLLFFSSWVHDKENQNNNVGFTEGKSLKSKNYFSFFPVVLSQELRFTEVIMFLLSRKAEIKDLLIQRTFRRTDLVDECILFGFVRNF